MEKLFWTLTAIIIYTYIGYGILLYIMVFLKRLFTKKQKRNKEKDYPAATIIVAAFNEEDVIREKIKNSFSLNYPEHKLHLLVITDGSTDNTPAIVKSIPGVTLLHEDERRGKAAALNRAMAHVNTPLAIFTDANTTLNPNAITEIADAFKDPKIGCVAGEKVILKDDNNESSARGEGAYWRYESTLKKLDSELYSAVGAAGELFAVRTKLYEDLPEDTLLDDFVISLRLAAKGYKTHYTSKAYASETASANSHEEMKRKVRIAAGGWQSIMRLLPLLNIFRYHILSFQYISHRVFRWTITPLALILLIPVNIYLALYNPLFMYILFLHLGFYATAFSGHFAQKKFKIPGLMLVPYYFTFMNIAVLMGFFRYIKNKQPVNWERAKRVQVEMKAS